MEKFKNNISFYPLYKIATTLTVNEKSFFTYLDSLICFIGKEIMLFNKSFRASFRKLRKIPIQFQFNMFIIFICFETCY